MYKISSRFAGIYGISREIFPNLNANELYTMCVSEANTQCIAVTGDMCICMQKVVCVWLDLAKIEIALNF